MRNDLSPLEMLLSRERLENLRRGGVMFFDVDDTLLARRTTAFEKDQIFSQSPAALSVPLLLQAGIRVCLITGHGWQQLERRFVLPLIEYVTKYFADNRADILQRFFVYANRGATKITWNAGVYEQAADYGKNFSINEEDSVQLQKILAELAKTFTEEFRKEEGYYRQNFPNFAFDELPPQILEREGVVLSLRPVPSAARDGNTFESPRERLVSLGCKLLEEAGLDINYELAQSGTSTLEVNRKTVSKKIAFQDLISQIAEEQSLSPEDVEKSSIYVGDEFSPGGNDFIIPQNFPNCLCFSVAAAKQEPLPENVIFLDKFFNCQGIPATTALNTRILSFLT